MQLLRKLMIVGPGAGCVTVPALLVVVLLPSLATAAADTGCSAAGCSDGDLLLHCARVDAVANRCRQLPAAKAAWCRCCRACPARTAALVADRRRARRRVRKRLRRLVRRLSAMQRRGAKRPRHVDATGDGGGGSAAADRGRLMERLLQLELRLLNLSGRRPDRSRGRDRAGSWGRSSLERQYFVDEPAAASGGQFDVPATTATEAAATTPTSMSVLAIDVGGQLAWLTHLEAQRTAKAKEVCQRVTCSRSKGELCLTNIQDLPVCRCVTSVNCITERRRLKVELRRSRGVRARASNRQALKQFSGRVCAHLSGLPTERTYQSVCHMRAAACASDSQILRLGGGACANYDPESEALEQLTNRKCARCEARGWRSRGCRRWRRKCRRAAVR